MSNYTKATNFTAKDGLPAGNSSKVVKGVELDTEFTAIASAISSKSDSNSPTFTGTPLAPTAAGGTNNTQIATTSFVSTAVAASFPTGGIILWSGSVASIPSGWALCNGSNGTPDLRNRFVVGAGSAYAVDATGGSADATLPTHTHTFSATTASTSLTGAIIGISESFNGHGSATGVFTKAQGDPVAGTPSGATDTSNGGRVTMDATHTHTVSGTTASAGSSGTNANLPPYYALAYIIKT
jgi:microcystin-dependent protein